MSIQSEITRLTGLRNRLRTALVTLGLAQSGATLDDCTSAVESIQNRGTPSASVKEGETYSILPGYYKGGTVAGVAGGGSYELQDKVVTPTKAQQVVSSDDGKYGLGTVTVEAIPENYNDTSSVTAAAADVLATKIIVTAAGQSVAGTMVNNGAVSATIDGLTATSYTIPKGYHNGAGKVTLTNDIETALAAI